ncbi:hypothetical protein [Nostoc sp. ATCC 53789]|uniref:hypothetical protein n=1 Tax=Nostoc sp. ATCC 53789 TaxID=76335 RepID=UPI000DEC11EE|nr:hypothetical protein [Nostoc sp. ATCC 53789]QHG20359.1 hypothetical protein GJB62_31040 [Nostoc sp. ATCC 53789]RCJ16509.1 hypothetical protein A6V25_31215 [Nostoc sp. ATCC 53789]
MTYIIYSQQQLQLKSIARLKQIYSEIGCTVEVSDKRCKDSWITAIAEYQASKIQKLTLAAPDEQALAQAELDNYIADQAQAVAPELLTIVEISFDHHEYYADDKLIASISHDDNHLTQRWVVMVNNKEIFRANTLMRCDRFICTHYKDGSLPVQEQLATPCTTGNEVMAQIFNECEKYGFEILDDGIYHNDVKLGEVGQTDGNWWFTRAADETQHIACDSAMNVVQSLSMLNVSTDGKSIFDEYFLDQPLEQLTGDRLQRLLEKAELVTA